MSFYTFAGICSYPAHDNEHVATQKVKCSFNQFRIENLYYFVELERGIRISLPAEWRYMQVFSRL